MYRIYVNIRVHGVLFMKNVALNINDRADAKSAAQTFLNEVIAEKGFVAKGCTFEIVE